MECTTHHTSNNLSKKIEEARWVNSDPKNPPNGDRMEHYPLVVVKELLLQLLSHPRRRQLGHLEVVVRGSVGLRPNVPISFNGLYHSQTLFRLNQALRSLQL